MKIKENLKLLVIFTIALLSIVLLTAKVQAEDTELTDEQKYDIIAQTILDEIPDTVETDLKEIENIKGNANKKLPTEIIEDASGEKLDEIIKKLGGIGSGGDISISLDDDFNIDSSYKYSDINDFYKAKVVVKINNSYSKTKIIKVIYGNHKDYNEKDATYIKNFKIDNKRYIEISLDEVSNPNFLTTLEEYYQKMFNDESITVKASTDYKSSTYLNQQIGNANSEVGLLIFKNDVLYDWRKVGMSISIPVVEIPFTVPDNEIKNYALDVIKSRYEYMYDTNKLSIEKGIGKGAQDDWNIDIEQNINNGYTIYNDVKGEKIPFGYVIIKNPLTDELAQKMVDMIPDNIEINLKEIENMYDEAENLIKEKLQKIWLENSIDSEVVKNLLQDRNSQCIFTEGGYKYAYAYSSIKDFYKVHIDLKGKEKTVNIVYSNHKDYNVEDEKYIKSMKVDTNKIYEISLKDAQYGNYDFPAIIEKYYNELFDDKDITVKCQTGMGGGTSLNASMYVTIAIFKNEVLYDIRNIEWQTTIPVITIPSTVKEDEEINYALDLIKETFNDISSLSIKKGISESAENYLGNVDNNIPNIYTVYTKIDSNEEVFGVVIIRKEMITLTDKETDIQFVAPKDVVPENTVLEAKIINDETTLNQIRVSMQDTSTKYVTYDITLKSDNVAIQPNGKVEISIPIPDDFDKSNLAVYRIEPNGDKIVYEVTIQTINGKEYAVFETDHFSNYVLAEKIVSSKPEHILDDEPKTGYNLSNIMQVILSLATVGFTVSIKKYIK